MKEKRKHLLGPIAKRDQHRTRVPTRGLRLSALVHEVELSYTCPRLASRGLGQVSERILTSVHQHLELSLQTGRASA